MRGETTNAPAYSGCCSFSLALAVTAGCWVQHASNGSDGPRRFPADEAAIRSGTVLLWTDAYNAGEVDKIVAPLQRRMRW